MNPRGYTPPVLPEEEAIIYGDDGATPLTILQTYLFGLIRRSMNRKTGIAGDKTRISWGGLYERAYEDARPGYAGTGDAWGATRDKRILYVRNQVRRIEKLGLIRLVSGQGGLLQIEFVIFKKYCSVYFSAQKEVTTNLPLDVTTNLPSDTASNNSDLGKVDSPEVTTHKPEEVTTYPEVSRDTYRQAGRDDRFPMPPDWQPSDNFFMAMQAAPHLGIDGDNKKLFAEVLSEYRLYWMTDEAQESYPNKAKRTQSSWEHGLQKQFSYVLANPAKQSKPQTAKRPFRMTTKQDVIQSRNKQVSDSWLPPELRQGAGA